MLTYQGTLRLARDYLGKTSAELQSEPVCILEDQTIERSFGWVFFFNSVKFLQTRYPLDRLLGNGPLLVDKSKGCIIQLGTAHAVEKYIEDYESPGNVSYRYD